MIGPKVKRIVLIGFRGGGKSTIGKLLAKKLTWQYISTDDEIELRENEPISQIVRKNGWDYFRKLETEVVMALDNSQSAVVDAGGGVAENEEIMDRLVHQSIVIWIDANIETIRNRLQKKKDRPLLDQDNLIADIEVNYPRRLPVYQKYSELRFNTSNKTADEICNKIISEMRQT